VLFVVPRTDQELSNVLSVAHVLLDPFPVSGSSLHVLLQALSIGLPVVTKPSSLLGGRLALGLYRLIDYGLHDSPGAAFSSSEAAGEGGGELSDLSSESAVRESVASLVVDSVHDYVTMALRLTHQPKLRSHHSLNLLNRRHLLFGENDATVLSDWQFFVRSALTNSTTYALRSM
jgi:predicted O-linked N-acetylglucosamine transferase (SPINDLY family)